MMWFFYFIEPELLPNLVVTCQIDYSKNIENIELVEQKFISFETMLDSK